jgi:quercetin dioxygenase-like cupin family protein
MNDYSLLITKINGRHSLIKPPLSVSLRSGSVSLEPGEEVGEHKTEGREEAIIILHGTATVVCEGEAYEAKEKQFVYIPPESVHNIINNSKKLLEYVYIVTPVGNASIEGHSHSH